MAQDRLTFVRRNALAASAAALLLSAGHSVPAIAASTNRVDCPATEQANLAVPANELAAQLVNHEPSVVIIDEEAPESNEQFLSLTQLLTPLAEAAIREAFKELDAPETLSSLPVMMPVNSVSGPLADADTASEDDEEAVEETRNDSGMNTKLPGVSETEFSRFQKQMFRRDI